jgi:hypothetical protein
MLVLEDDVFADDHQLIQKLMGHFQDDVLSVSVAYPHREQPHNFCCWDDRHKFVSRCDSTPGVREIKGHGFGCCMFDVEKARAVLNAVSGSIPARQHFDWDFFNASKYRSLVDFAIPAEHLFA